MMKRIIAGLLTVAMLVTGPGFSEAAHAAETAEQQSTMDMNDVSVEGSSSVGELLAAELDEELENELGNNGCNIVDVTLDGTVATVSFCTVQPAVLTVGIYDENGLQMLASGSTEVYVEDRQVSVNIETDSMPEYFYIKAYLVEANSLRPLSCEFTSDYYTQDMQEFLAKTTDDFDEDRVLNFDTDTTNNFAVYRENTQIISQGAGVNTLVSANEDTNTYVFANADNMLTSLQAGDIFVYRAEGSSELVLKVDSITVDGTDVTIITTETSVEEVFSYVKIDAIATLEGTETASDEKMSAEGMGIEEIPHVGVIDAEDSLKEKEIPIDIFEAEFENDNVSASVTVEGSLKIIFHYKLYYDMKILEDDDIFVKLTADYEASLEVSVSGEFSKEIPLGLATGYNFPIFEILTINIKPVIVLEASAEITTTYLGIQWVWSFRKRHYYE